jgi:hypothetical protein
MSSFYKVFHPTSVMKADIFLSEEYHNQCVQEVYRIGDEMSKQTNLKCDRSDWDVFNKTDVFHDVLHNVLQIVSEVDWLPSNIELSLVEAWSAVYKKGEWADKHSHNPALLSFCYYLKADKTSSPIVFSDTDLSFVPYSGMCLVFPAYLNHHVPYQEEEEDRIVIAGNFNGRVVYDEQ